MAQAVRTSAQFNVISSPTIWGIAKFCELVNKLFDLTNGIASFDSINAANVEAKHQAIST
jgi:hypothetical protein